MVHGGRCQRDALDARWQETQRTRPQAEQVLGRMDRVLEQLPQARKQARECILARRQVPNDEKIISLYVPDTHVIVRKKAGAEVALGNTLLLGENPQGLLMDWQLCQESAPADSQLLPGSVGRMERAYGPVNAITGDRGLDSFTNQVGLEDDGIGLSSAPPRPTSRTSTASWPRR